uniref:NADH-ubiquinone oxidoreductase chain 1 n=1 Tax=Lepidonotus sp. YZ-2018 TaxID=2153334 RepID=A0A343W6B4_9ANNE|nr:NADH dehydrogenase subunit 1 [Lepidonotus sp. YZ-2018]
MSFIPFVNILISFVMALLGMAFYTLLERKILGYAQLRKGPNKVGVSGIPQPFADALKLLAKEQSKPSLSNFIPFLATPVLSLFLALTIWILYPSSFPTHFFIFGTLFFLCVSSLNVYTTLAAGWTSNSKYSLLGALRGVAQTISYEVSMALILLSPLILICSFDISFINMNQSSWILFLMVPLFSTWFTTALAETNRTPFDFAEGESELVSGFNTEYSSGSFALIFMAEYTNILMMSLLSAIFFTGMIQMPLLNNLFLLLKTTILAFVFLWIRASFPRMRYDRLMNLTWKSFLPFSLGALMFLCPISFLLS